MTSIIVPGKLFLAGEYAITHPGNLAIIATTEMGLSITISDAETASSAHSNTILTDWSFDLTQFSEDWTDDWRFVRAAIKIIRDYITYKQLPNLSNIEITITSDMTSSLGKLGLGSSAAVVVGIIEAINTHFKLNIDILTRFKLASLAHLHVQKNGSLGDIAAITYGGVITYRSPDLSAYQTIDKNWLRPELAEKNWPKLNIEPIAWPSTWQLILGATQESADTKSALSKQQLSQCFLNDSDQIVANVIKAISNQDYQQLTVWLKKNQILLSQNLPVTYITPKLAYLLSTLTDIAGKISGAGFGDNGFAIVQSDSDNLIKDWQSHQIMAKSMTIAPQKRG